MERILMQEAIDAAWQTTEPGARELQLQIFPEGKPDVDTFVARIADCLRKSNPSCRRVD